MQQTSVDEKEATIAAGGSTSSASLSMARDGKVTEASCQGQGKEEDKKYLRGSSHRLLQQGDGIKIEGPLPIRLKKKRADWKGRRPRTIA